MKYLIIGVVSCISLGAFANMADKDWEKLPFEQQKQVKTEKLEKKSAMIKKEMSCVNQAKTKNDLKACRETMEKDKQAMMDEWKNKKKQSQEKVEEEMEDGM